MKTFNILVSHKRTIYKDLVKIHRKFLLALTEMLKNALFFNMYSNM